VRDPPPVHRLRSERLVGVKRIEVAGDAGEGDEVSLGDRPGGRLKAEADLDVLEVQRGHESGLLARTLLDHDRF
jgi:hypothetical protein